ncbi:MAG: TUL4 family lipoprotein [Gammaproteobacteria bacterium]|nr:TUL4 family lipoprotein [Gammaproteobacteria bacterium]
MKNTIKLALVAVAVLGLAGCASNGYKSNQAMKPSSSKMTSSKTTSTISLKTQGSLLVANVTTNWDPKTNDSLAIVWTAPANNYCDNSQFPITKGHQSNDLSWAYRTVVRNNQTCNGTWTAKVVNTNTGKVLASAQLNVAVQPAPVAPVAAPAAATAPAKVAS